MRKRPVFDCHFLIVFGALPLHNDLKRLVIGLAHDVVKVVIDNITGNHLSLFILFFELALILLQEKGFIFQ